MDPIDYRNATWEDLQDRVSALRLAALVAWRTHGPGTTRQVAARSGMDLLTFRPRTTELYQLGYVMLLDQPGTVAKGEGIYAALTDAEAREVFEARCRQARAGMATCQPELKLTQPAPTVPETQAV